MWVQALIFAVIGVATPDEELAAARAHIEAFEFDEALEVLTRTSSVTQEAFTRARIATMRAEIALVDQRGWDAFLLLRQAHQASRAGFEEEVARTGRGLRALATCAADAPASGVVRDEELLIGILGPRSSSLSSRGRNAEMNRLLALGNLDCAERFAPPPPPPVVVVREPGPEPGGPVLTAESPAAPKRSFGVAAGVSAGVAVAAAIAGSLLLYDAAATVEGSAPRNFAGNVEGAEARLAGAGAAFGAAGVAAALSLTFALLPTGGD